MTTKDNAHKIVAEVLRLNKNRDDDFALTIAIVDALWIAGLGEQCSPDHLHYTIEFEAE